MRRSREARGNDGGAWRSVEKRGESVGRSAEALTRVGTCWKDWGSVETKWEGVGKRHGGEERRKLEQRGVCGGKRRNRVGNSGNALGRVGKRSERGGKGGESWGGLESGGVAKRGKRVWNRGQELGSVWKGRKRGYRVGKRGESVKRRREIIWEEWRLVGRAWRRLEKRGERLEKRGEACGKSGKERARKNFKLFQIYFQNTNRSEKQIRYLVRNPWYRQFLLRLIRRTRRPQPLPSPSPVELFWWSSACPGRICGH